MPGPAGQHTHILQQERATKKVTGGAAYGHVLVSHPVPIYAPLKVVLTG